MEMFPEDLVFNPESVEEIEETDLTCNDYEGTEFILRGLPELQSVYVESDCFRSIRTFELNGLNALERVEIGGWSFTTANNYNDVESNRRSDGSFAIMNSPRLRTITIDEMSFSDYSSFQLSNLPSLQSIEVGVYSFYNAPTISLSGCDYSAL